MQYRVPPVKPVTRTVRRAVTVIDVLRTSEADRSVTEGREEIIVGADVGSEEGVVIGDPVRLEVGAVAGDAVGANVGAGKRNIWKCK